MKKTWQQKMEDKPSLPKVINLERGFPCYNAVHKMGAGEGEPIVLVNASEITPLMASVPTGKVVTIREICLKLATQHGVKGCCSLTTGIFIMTIANAVEEMAMAEPAAGLAGIPYWRTLKAEGYLNEKYPGGQEKQKQHLEEEGMEIVARGKRYQVKEWQKYLWKLS